jgi:hypothetical protein
MKGNTDRELIPYPSARQTPNHPQVASSVSKETATLVDSVMIFFPFPESSDIAINMLQD